MSEHEVPNPDKFMWKSAEGLIIKRPEKKPKDEPPKDDKKE
ncbi:hypothetical protein ACP26L_25645 [Paenibacillus sp. S-38]